MSKYSDLLFTQATPQSQPISSSNVQGQKASVQRQNNAGGFVFTLDKFKRLERFLILGSDSNTYYQKAPTLTKENASCVTECWTENYEKTWNIIENISWSGRAPKNSPAIFAIALGAIHKDEKVRQSAFKLVPLVCRTSTHLFEFVDTCKKLGKGWGRGMKNAVADWYNSKTDEQLAYQLVKYRQREGYTHERLIRLSHPTMEVTSDARHAMYDWLRGREVEGSHLVLPSKIVAHQSAMKKREDDPLHLVRLCEMIAEENLPWEALPTWANTKPEVWQAMLPKMPLNAMIRNLGNMTRLGVFNSNFIVGGRAIQRIATAEELKRARIHPFNILNALKTYQSGHGFRGSHTWQPSKPLCDTLEDAFYKSFDLIVPSNKRIMLALDVSGSMTGSVLFNSNLSAREASAAMAMATLAVEENCIVTGFTSLHAHNRPGGAISQLNINRGMSLETITRYTASLPFSGTDCALPMLYALEHQLEIDAFVVYTDSETWAGNIHAVEALKLYRNKAGIEAKLIVVGMTSTGFTIADPNDAGMLDIVGFDASAPAVIAEFLSDKYALLEDNIRAISEDMEPSEAE